VATTGVVEGKNRQRLGRNGSEGIQVSRRGRCRVRLASVSLSIDNGVGTVTGTSKNVSLTGNTIYTLTASDTARMQRKIGLASQRKFAG
jgi:hypothetical protein